MIKKNPRLLAGTPDTMINSTATTNYEFNFLAKCIENVT